MLTPLSRTNNLMKHSEKLLTKIQYFKLDETLCDITIVVDNQKFVLHKLVLASCSDYFKALFTSDLSEKTKKEIEISHLSPTAFKDCISYMYHGDWNFSLEGTKDLLCAVNMLLLEDMKSLCTEKIKENINIGNCLNLYHYSVLYNNKSLELNMKEFLNENTEKLLANDSFIKEVPTETFEMFLRSEDVCISGEASLFDALVKWTAVDPQSRQAEFCKLIEFVRLPMIKREHFTAFVDTNKHLSSDCPSCNPYFWKCVRHLIDGETHDLTEKQLHNRHSIADKNRAIFLLAEPERQIKRFDNDNGNGSFHSIPSLFKPPQDEEYRRESVAYHKDAFYFVGTKNKKSLYIDMKQRPRKWTELPPIPNQHCEKFGPKVVSFYDMILVIGGDTDTIIKEKASSDAVATVDCLDIKTKRWITFPCLNRPRCLFSCMVHGCRAYVLGGWNTRNLRSVEMYDPDHKLWKLLPSMNVARQSPAAEFYKYKIFVSGGCHGAEKSVETFREGGTSWTLISCMNIGRYRHSMFTYNNQLYVMGGCRENRLSVFEKWDNEKEKWEKSETVNDTIHSCSVFKLPRKR